MTSSEDFKQAIRSGNISEAFLVAMSNAPELNITTTIVTADGQKIDAEDGQMDNYLHTHINLIEGKVENEIGEKLTGDRYSEIKQFHIQQVTQGHQTIQHNLISLQKMFQLMSSFQQQQATNRASWVDVAANVAQGSLPTQAPNSKLYGNQPNALEASKMAHQNRINNATTEVNENNSEPQLPSFDAEDEQMVNDLLSLADLDDAPESPASATEQPTQQDWSEWLDDEPDVQTGVFDLKSLNIKEAKENWHNWEEQNQAIDTENPQ
ncbi:MAG: hypothetical protein HC930_09565 [Hydrococcus sp. SU_1_0]|nr:hypothetical protein [Hydrococcus sp. SU_1_0]